jgi:hypothetical protein
VRHGRDVHDLRHFNAHVVQGADGALAATTGSFHEDLDLLQAVLHGFLATILSSALRSVRRVLLGTAESHLTGAGPGNNLPSGIGEGNDDVVEGGVDVGLAHGIHFDLLLRLFGGLGHLLGELIDSASQVRDRELLLLVCDCLPLSLTGTGVVLRALSAEGQTQTVTDAALATNVHQSLDVHLDFRAKLTFNADLRDDFADLGDFVVGPILYTLVLGNRGLAENVLGA